MLHSPYPMFVGCLEMYLYIIESEYQQSVSLACLEYFANRPKIKFTSCLHDRVCTMHVVE